MSSGYVHKYRSFYDAPCGRNVYSTAIESNDASETDRIYTMSIVKQSQQFGIHGLAVQTWREAISVVADLGRTVAGGLARLGQERTGVGTAAYVDAAVREHAAQ